MILHLEQSDLVDKKITNPSISDFKSHTHHIVELADVVVFQMGYPGEILPNSIQVLKNRWGIPMKRNTPESKLSRYDIALGNTLPF